MRYVVLDLGLFEPRCGSIRWSEKIVHQLLEILATANLEYLKCAPVKPPSIYKAGVVYKREPPGREEFKAIPAILRTGHADCEDLAAWRVAELRYIGEPAQFLVKKWVRPTSYGVPFYLYHILVRRADGRDEDPSKALGMEGQA